MPAEAPGLLPSCGGQFMSATPTRLPFLSPPGTIPGLSMNIYPSRRRVSRASTRRIHSAEPGRRPGGLSVRVAYWRRARSAQRGRVIAACPRVRSFSASPLAAGHAHVLVLAMPEISHCWSRHICARWVRVSVVATRSAMRGRHELARAVDDRATASPWAGCTWGLKAGVVGRAAYATSRYHRRNRAVPVGVVPLEQVRRERSEHHQDTPRGVVSRSFVLRPRMGRWSPVKHSKSSLPRTPGQLS
jgi:hypothetical protein